MLKCKHCGHVVPEKAMRHEIAMLMVARRENKRTLTPEQAREFGLQGAEKRWGKSRKKQIA
jgi:hypothetical protein